jgi:Arc/MetJ-type ribon-helix-helix transcriptional regulator
MQISIALPDSYKERVQALADRETFGNVTMLVRLALANQYPELKTLPNSTRQKRGTGKGKARE